MCRSHPQSPLFPYTTLFRSPHSAAIGVAIGVVVRGTDEDVGARIAINVAGRCDRPAIQSIGLTAPKRPSYRGLYARRSEEHTSELQSHSDLVCRLLLEKKK